MVLEGASSLSLLTLAIALSLWVLAKAVSPKQYDLREPPVVPSSAPFVGHVFGILRYGAGYFRYLGSRFSHPIFALQTLTSKTYVVVDPGLAASVQRASKALSFNPIIPEVTQRVLGLDDQTKKIVATNIDRDGSVRGFYPDVQDTIYSTLTPGGALDDLNLRAYTEFSNMLDSDAEELMSEKLKSREVDLMAWVQHIVTIATARFLYGPKNPITMHPNLEQAFWDFVHGIPRLLLNTLPAYTARTAYKGREALAAAYVEYLIHGHDKLGSNITQERIAVGRKHGFTLPNLARSEISFLFAGIINTTFASFWMILHIFARPHLLQEIRAELETNALLTSPKEVADIRQLQINKINKACPLLLATFRETLRLHSDVLSSRVVTTDTLLQDKYFLRKGSVLQISGGIMHADARIWGDKVNEFCPERFFNSSNGQIPLAATHKSNGSNDDKPKQVHPAAFRAFGGGATLCPGRHFAQAEILGFVAMVLLRFDLASVTEGKDIQIPGKKDDVLPIHILEPKEKASVKMSDRAGWGHVQWEVVP
ncbi:uncharacterized protein A1O9_05531 [Exophiala aquamarina CBS 119918]|uniref:Cytochrome P450 oxidoreductase n=1 Tax=Exophiala aquamarina CBS 119918 TaxID=1182545 RepID=A0A072PE92_9EURO|nr:uncharacterized protein A1O9_05531 [Exophiala aquamarina CBS 119918]KEF57613.1 hypothetical protein A1O9_05531 [Exophiala aquamarina CBS 119918]